ncbi:T6SS immunity protein Tdi1 domain-containing protein [Pedobacter sp. R20-19]|uniref:T6SS immunity protein Tdi1 domain-containing protein n=1 Tax=Pedobacter sp. R20-19 TaxID=1270196 RepID=UPI000493540D|nr:T6SS immunity protein Tdi1 domain-containing protein [Pedobacter sp. R20-19]
MFTKFIDTYGNIENNKRIPADDLLRIKGDLSPEIFELLEQGEGSYMDGFLWVVNPLEYTDLISEVYLPITSPSICFARDAFGCLYLWEDESIIFVDIIHTKQELVGRKANVFFNLKMTDIGFLNKKTSFKNYLNAKERLGMPKIDECYGYIPLIGMGGSENVENLEKVKIKEYISIVSQALGQIQ